MWRIFYAIAWPTKCPLATPPCASARIYRHSNSGTYLRNISSLPILQRHPPIAINFSMRITNSFFHWMEYPYSAIPVVKNWIISSNGHPWCALHTVVHLIVLPLSLWALCHFQSGTGDWGLCLDILALQQLRSHILEIIATTYKCAPQHRLIH